MNALEELMVCLSTKDRLAFLQFRQKYVSAYGSDKFKRLLKQAEKGLANESEKTESNDNENTSY